jgi:DNA repair protein RecN (Recombination protein N)
MLTHLSIQNYALIQQLSIDFNQGLTIITGETGAGKSILLGALALVAGNRADTQALQDKTKKCIVEASFDLRKSNLQDYFVNNNLDYETLTTIRREINPEGKSRAFINDTPVTLSQLKELATNLVDIHSQHETRTLNGSAFQLTVVDAFANNTETIALYLSNYKQYKALDKKLNELIDKEIQAKKELDYLQFQFNELDELNLKLGEQESNEQELETLNNAENIKATLSKAAFSLNGSEMNLLSSFAEIKNTITSIAKFKPEINELNTRINSTYIELKDIANELESIEQEIIYDPNRIELLNERLDAIYRLQQKHQVKTIEALIGIKDTISEQLLEYSSLENEIAKLKLAKDKAEKQLSAIAQKLSDARKKTIPKIEKEIAQLLSTLSMPNAALKIELNALPQFSLTGKDEVRFLFTANKGSDFKDLDKVASGGELSRLMLSIKSLLANLTELPTIIFDEIDTGVSGDVADKVGKIMDAMAATMQVIAITHLPQIASKGKEHLFVYKEEKKEATYTNIKKLTKEERINEIAKMLSTENPTTAAISNAKELLKAN